jgi:hypothetical protein
MGYYIRVFAKSDTIPSIARLQTVVPPGQELSSESGEELAWTQLVLRHKTGQEIALVERNPVTPGELGEEELNEFLEDIRHEKPDSAVEWLLQFLPRVKAIYAFQLLSGTELEAGWEGVHAVRTAIWNDVGGILQADLEGLSNEDGYHILWQFIGDHEGPPAVAVLNDDKATWTAFEIKLDNPEHKAAFLDGSVPQGAKLL